MVQHVCLESCQAPRQSFFFFVCWLHKEFLTFVSSLISGLPCSDETQQLHNIDASSLCLFPRWTLSDNIYSSTCSSTSRTARSFLSCVSWSPARFSRSGISMPHTLQQVDVPAITQRAQKQRQSSLCDKIYQRIHQHHDCDLSMLFPSVLPHTFGRPTIAITLELRLTLRPFCVCLADQSERFLELSVAKRYS